MPFFIHSPEIPPNFKFIMDFTHYEPLVKLVKKEIGIGYTIKDSVEEDLKTGTLFELPVDGINYTTNVGLIYDDNYLSLASRKFIQMI